MKPHEQHRSAAHRHLKVAIVTVSTSRYEKKRRGVDFADEAGDVAEMETRRAGHAVVLRDLISDDPAMLRRAVKSFLTGKGDVLLFTGGTGLSPRDITVETVRPYFDKELEGFGELVRRLGYEEIGSSAILTRATAGVARGKLIVCMPGSPGGVRTAMKASVNEFPHMVFIAKG